MSDCVISLTSVFLEIWTSDHPAIYNTHWLKVIQGQIVNKYKALALPAIGRLTKLNMNFGVDK